MPAVCLITEPMSMCLLLSGSSWSSRCHLRSIGILVHTKQISLYLMHYTKENIQLEGPAETGESGQLE